ncbi:hypothetical protein AM1BK_29730 [Neobacillus kokaensis]|uniref:Uncharacterized protein n=1 Tax=Neobacillus kokaensis TaxID=2759023 RepID=A0ABQ3N9L3_9BACI|nr:hypothetical protein AM1BK_29730 [Neobacillus kokaensis]
MPGAFLFCIAGRYILKSFKNITFYFIGIQNKTNKSDYYIINLLYGGNKSNFNKFPGNI